MFGAPKVEGCDDSMLVKMQAFTYSLWMGVHLAIGQTFGVNRMALDPNGRHILSYLVHWNCWFISRLEFSAAEWSLITSLCGRF